MTDEETQMRLQSLEDYPGQLRSLVNTHNTTLKQIQVDLQTILEDYSKFKQSIYTIHPELLV